MAAYEKARMTVAARGHRSAACQGEIGEGEPRDDKQGEVVHVLVRAQHERSRDGEREVEPRLVRSPAQGKCNERQQEKEDHARGSPASGQRLENVP